MKKSKKSRKPANLSYPVYVGVSNYGATSGDVTHFSFEHEFTDPNPLVARVQAFESINLAYEAMMLMTHCGFLNITSPTQAEQRGWMNYSSFSYTITLKVTDDEGNLEYEEPLNNYGGENEAINGLTDEYEFYKDYGYDMGETMELEDGEIVLMTDTRYIYDRS